MRFILIFLVKTATLIHKVKDSLLITQKDSLQYGNVKVEILEIISRMRALRKCFAFLEILPFPPQTRLRHSFEKNY